MPSSFFFFFRDWIQANAEIEVRRRLQKNRCALAAAGWGKLLCDPGLTGNWACAPRACPFRLRGDRWARRAARQASPKANAARSWAWRGAYSPEAREPRNAAPPAARTAGRWVRTRQGAAESAFSLCRLPPTSPHQAGSSREPLSPPGSASGQTCSCEASSGGVGTTGTPAGLAQETPEVLVVSLDGNSHHSPSWQLFCF